MFTQPQRVYRAVQQTGHLVPGRLPVGGINARDPLAVMPETDAIELLNVVVDDRGIGTRKGYELWAWNLPGNASVPTIMSYYPATAELSGINRRSLLTPYTIPRASIVVGGRVFACTSLAIFDITEGGAGPWTPQANIGPVESDYWTWRNFQNAGGNFLLACNNEGGYVSYSGGAFDDGFNAGFQNDATGFQRITFGTNPGQISPVNPDLLVYLMVWKRRLWFIEKNSTRAWYLPVEQITGTAKQFDFGSHFRHGGRLIALVNWTLDGGEGIDDYLVAVGSEGDVVVFKGYDPDAAAEDPNAFSLHGIWYVGALPLGFRQVDPYGGDVYILSVLGLTSLAKLVGQGDPSSVMQQTGGISTKINPLLTNLIAASNRSANWFVKLLPREELAVIGVPQIVTRQGVGEFAFKLSQQAWSKFADLPFAHYTNHDNLIFAGGEISRDVQAAGRVYLAFDVVYDNVVPDAQLGTPVAIRCRVVPAYSGFGFPGVIKQYPMVRLVALAETYSDVSVSILTDYQTQTYVSKPSLTPNEAALWDVDLWDVGRWGGTPLPITAWIGTRGEGFAAAAQIDYVTLGNTKLTNIDWFVKPGGIL